MWFHTLGQWLAYVASLGPQHISKNLLMSPWFGPHNSGVTYKNGIGIPTSDVAWFALTVLLLVAVICVVISRGLRAARHQRLN